MASSAHPALTARLASDSPGINDCSTQDLKPFRMADDKTSWLLTAEARLMTAGFPVTLPVLNIRLVSARESNAAADD